MNHLRTSALLAAAALLLSACSDSTGGDTPLATATFETHATGSYQGTNSGYAYFQHFIGQGGASDEIGIVLADTTFGSTLRQELIINRNQPLVPGTYPVQRTFPGVNAFTSSVLVQLTSSPFSDLSVPNFDGTVTIESASDSEIRGSYDLTRSGNDPRDNKPFNLHLTGRFAAAAWHSGNPF